MIERELIQLMKKYKNATEFGGEFSVEDLDRGWNKICEKLGWDVNEIKNQKNYTFADCVSYILWQARGVTLRPVAYVASLFLIVFAGWITTVNASIYSLPGDVLYPVKIATERVQLSLATSTEQRLRLRSEFAGRRLQEAATITASAGSADDGRVKSALNDFQNQITSAKGDLVSLRSSRSSASAAAAIALDQKTDEFRSYISQTGSANSEATQEVKNAEEAVDQVADEAVQVLVENQESSGGVEGLQQTFRKRVDDVTSRLSLNMGRLLTSEKAINQIPDTATRVALVQIIQKIRSTLQVQQSALPNIMNMFAAGGYRSAFELMNQVSDALKIAEETISQVEIQISTSMYE